MTKLKNIEEWKKAKRRYGLTDMHIQMARDLGLNPKKFGSLANHKQQPWKAPLPDFIEDLYFKHFKKERPEVVKPLTRSATK
jgi:hypothetical protein